MTIERWQTFTKQQQLLMIWSEFKRAETWQFKDPELFAGALMRAQELVDLTKLDSKWQTIHEMIIGVDFVMNQYRSHERTDSIGRLYRAL